MNNLAFDIVHVEQRGPTDWHVGGRALTDICIGDTLEIRRPYIPSMGDEGTFVVIAITAYNRSMTKIDYGMMATLTLHYDQGALLNQGMALVHTTTGPPPNAEQYRSGIDPMLTIRIEGDSRTELLAFKQSLKAHAEDLQFQRIAAIRDRFVVHGALFPRATPSNIEHFIAILRRFNETVDTLLGLSFVQHIRERENDAKQWEDRIDNHQKRSQWKLSFVQSLVNHRNKAKIRSARAANDQYLFNAIAKGPSSEATAAFVLTMRCFIDDTEECSLENLAQYYKAATIGTEPARLYLGNQNVFAMVLDGVTELVDRYPVVDTKGNVIDRIDKPLTRRQVFDLWVYGGLSHAKRTKKQQFDALVGDPVTRALLWQSFADTLDDYCNHLSAQSYVNKAMLLELEKPV
ncbi:hypothetical protein [Herpetosiphon geysericola]|uniref:Uncharacterized protein n=1 Tax=Herpetosiphon geysericola TaxID=70996 RepID=A0A0P6XZE5_9CHLR|nr:hypothetical protein [Herpetosiphon geysericola]KPL85264.1 hypothetical protein SE18_16410 [Herpetosiphon geysericola]